MNKFPKDIINLILEFDGRIKYKRGKYINCIPNNDYRYALLSNLQIPAPVQYTMDYDCSHVEHFEYFINFNELYRLNVWNVPYNPPNKIQYFFYKINDYNIWYKWIRN